MCQNRSHHAMAVTRRSPNPMCLEGQLHYFWCIFRWLFWWLFVSNFCAFCCYTLQRHSHLHPYEYKCVMRRYALDCNLVQNGKNRTQNPPIARSWGFALPFPATNISFICNRLRWSIVSSDDLTDPSPVQIRYSEYPVYFQYVEDFWRVLFTSTLCNS
jgi:hypothetical protein